MKKVKELWLKWEKRLIVIAVMAILFGVFYMLNQPVLHGPYYVKYVYDGDTILCDIDGVDTKIRLIGIDAPELTIDGKENEKGLFAKEYMEKLLEHKKVYLQYDKQRTDKYSRTLAYVYLDGKSMVNKLLLSDGQAVRMNVAPNNRYAFQFFWIELFYSFSN